jgi:hypothetical protein
MRLNPRDPIIGLRHPHLGDVELSLGHFDDAIDEYHKAVDLGFRTFIPYAHLAAAFALDGKMEEAKSALGEARRLSSGLTVKWLIARAPNMPAPF